MSRGYYVGVWYGIRCAESDFVVSLANRPTCSRNDNHSISKGAKYCSICGGAVISNKDVKKYIPQIEQMLEEQEVTFWSFIHSENGDASGSGLVNIGDSIDLILGVKVCSISEYNSSPKTISVTQKHKDIVLDLVRKYGLETKEPELVLGIR